MIVFVLVDLCVLVFLIKCWDCPKSIGSLFTALLIVVSCLLTSTVRGYSEMTSSYLGAISCQFLATPPLKCKLKFAQFYDIFQFCKNFVLMSVWSILQSYYEYIIRIFLVCYMCILCIPDSPSTPTSSNFAGSPAY